VWSKITFILSHSLRNSLGINIFWLIRYLVQLYHVKYQGPNSMIARNIQWKPQQLMLIYQIYMTRKHESYEVFEVFFNTWYGLNYTSFLPTTWNCWSVIVLCLDSKNYLVNMHHEYITIVNLNSKYQHKINNSSMSWYLWTHYPQLWIVIKCSVGGGTSNIYVVNSMETPTTQLKS
jgi:hypothetical protein